jgi:hypothetical protein
MFGQSKTRSGDQIIFITLFSSKCIGLLHLLPASTNSPNMQEQNYSDEANHHISMGGKKNPLPWFSTLRLTIQASFAPLGLLTN